MQQPHDANATIVATKLRRLAKCRAEMLGSAIRVLAAAKRLAINPRRHSAQLKEGLYMIVAIRIQGTESLVHEAFNIAFHCPL